MPPEKIPDEWREYLVVKLTGWTFEEYDAADAVRTDWLLLMDDTVAQWRADKAKP